MNISSNEEKRNKKVLILSCGTGGGHNSAAKALQENLQDKGVQTDFVEYLDIINPKIRNRINNLYLKSVTGNGLVFKKVYHLGELYEKTKLKSPVYALNRLNRKKLFNYIQEKKYNYIITTHLFPSQALTSIKEKYNIHFMQIATDYVCIPFWKETNPDYFVIPNEDLKEDFIGKGMNKDKLLPFGIPVSKCYSQKYDSNECKKELGLDEDEKYVLLLNGSMGFGNVMQTVKRLLKEIKDINFIISCGNNKKLLETLNSEYKGNSRIIVLPFTNKLNKYIMSSEIILTKPGGLTTTEIATIRKPFIHTMPIPGCENYNANFFSEKKMSIKCENIQEIVENTKKLLNNKKLQEEMIYNQSKNINKDACNKIANFIINELK